MRFSIIIPVYNRPEELEELLQSICAQTGEHDFEVIVIDDGSDKRSNVLVSNYETQIDIKYCFKKNSGPGDSRNYGMKRASGTYFIMLDSDCMLPENYLSIVNDSLKAGYVDAYGGRDEAHESFSSWQKAVNYSMTSLLTTGGLRSKESDNNKFQLRSFNLGISKKAFVVTGGFSKQRIGEDIDLNYKLLEKDCSTKLIDDAFVYHKRRTSLGAFYKQTRNFGAARPILSKMHPGSAKFSYWLPSLFVLGFMLSILMSFTGMLLGIYVYSFYFVCIIIDSYIKNKSIAVGFLSLLSSFTQFFGYGLGYLRTVFRLYIQRKEPRDAFPGMFA
ncbi:glycosyltransferase [Lutimonas sp.]|uniref:glycosyltransferase n=1 Tax=Lutimonas sp. TaxID=1872403 RepID=UPI003D9B7AF5